MGIVTAAIVAFVFGILTHLFWDKQRRAYLAQRSSSFYDGGRYWLDALEAAPPRHFTNTAR